jgi:ribonuclease T1
MMNRSKIKSDYLSFVRLLLACVFGVVGIAFTDATFARDVPSFTNDTTQVLSTDLPKEAAQTLALVRKGGPFPHEKDGVVFGNREKQLPKQPRGYYTEYTVRTPGAKNRGARRLVVGGEPQTSKEIYYTDDHYQTFKRVKQVDK